MSTNDLFFNEDIAEYYDKELASYVRLWFAVLGQLYCDISTKTTNKYKLSKKQSAIKYVLSLEGKEDIKNICNLLDINYYKLYNFFVLTIKNSE